MAIDRNLLQQQVQTAQSGRGNVTFIKAGQKYRLRFVEFTDEQGRQQFARLVASWQRDNNIKTEILNRQITFGLTDAVARLRELCDENNIPFPYTRTRKQYYANAVDMDKSPYQMRRYAIPTTVWEAIVAYLMNDQWANVLEPKVGHGFEITGVKGPGGNMDVEYSAVATRDPWPVDDKLMAQVCDPLADVKDPGLLQQCEMLGMDPAELFPSLDTIEDIAPVVIEKPAAALAVASQATAPGNGAATGTPVAGVDFRSLLRGKTQPQAAPVQTAAAPKVSLPFANRQKATQPAPTAAPVQQAAPTTTAEQTASPAPAAVAAGASPKPPITSLVQGILNRKK